MVFIAGNIENVGDWLDATATIDLSHAKAINFAQAVETYNARHLRQTKAECLTLVPELAVESVKESKDQLHEQILKIAEFITQAKRITYKIHDSREITTNAYYVGPKETDEPGLIQVIDLDVLPRFLIGTQQDLVNYFGAVPTA